MWDSAWPIGVCTMPDALGQTPARDTNCTGGSVPPAGHAGVGLPGGPGRQPRTGALSHQHADHLEETKRPLVATAAILQRSPSQDSTR